MARLACSPPLGWRIQAKIALLIVVSSCAFGGSSPVSAESVGCVHGELQEDGVCACDNCWMGDNCDQYASHKPIFLRKFEEVLLNPLNEDMKAPIFTADAVDFDEKECHTKGNCPCSEIRYSFGSGNENGDFYIDTKTGEVKVSEDLRRSSMPIDEDGYKLPILAYNPNEDDIYDQMELRVVPSPLWNEMGINRVVDGFGEGYMGGSQPHHIQKRSTTITLPQNVSFTLTKTGNSENTTEMRVGTKVSFQLQILFPETTTDMLVELFAPDNDSIVMMLCDVKISSIGDNLAYNGAAQIVMDSQNSSTTYFDRAIIDFGNVTNSFTKKDSETHSSIYITWQAVMIQNEDTVNNGVYWVSAGAEYNYEMEVWVGQASFTAKTDTDPSSFGTPTFNLTGPSSMMIGTSAVFRLDMYIPQPSVFLSVDAFAPLNDTNVMSVCGMQVVDTGENYQCGFKPEEHEAVFHKDNNAADRGYGRSTLGLGTITNKGARETDNPTASNRITVEFVVHLYDDASYVGQSYYVGAAAEIGADQIWAGEISVSAIAFTPSTIINPPWDLTMEGNGKVSTVAPLLMTLDITIPQNTYGKYALEVLAPFNDSAAVLQLCSIRVLSVGDNLICTSSDITPIYTSRGNPMFTDRAYADLGTLTNVGAWGWQPYNLSDANATAPDVVRVQFLIKATNHSLATPGSRHSVAVGMLINGVSISLGSFPVEVEAAAAVPNVTDETTPDWDLSWLAGNGNVPIGGAGQFLLTITTKRNTVYSPFDLEALMPNSTGAPQVSVCKVQVQSIGANLPCVVASAINSSVAYTSTYDSTDDQTPSYDRAVVDLLSLCNYEMVNDTAQDVLVLKVGFKLHTDAGLTNGTELWPSVGVMFSPYKMWVGQIKTWARDDLTSSSNPPHVAVVKMSGDVPVGYFASYQVLIKTVPADLWPYTLNVSVSGSGLSVCNVKIIQVGDNMPCVDGATLEPFYEQDAEGANVKGSIDFGTIYNVGSGSVAADSTVDDNTIVVEVQISVSSDTAVISDGSSHTFAVQVDYGTRSLSATVPSFTAVHDTSSIDMTATNVSAVELNVEPITATDNGTDVVLGQSKLLRMCAWTYPGLVTKMSFKMLTPINTNGVMEVNYIGVSYGGKNLPCAGSYNAGTITYESRSGSSFTDIGTVDLGYLINNNFDTINPDANKVCVDGVVRILKNAILTTGSTVTASASVNVNDVEISVIQQTFTIIDISAFEDIYPDNGTVINGTLVSVNSSVPDPLSLQPGDVYALPVVANIPPKVTSVVTMDVKMEVNQSACLTYQDLRLISVGKNLKGFGKDYDLQCTPNSTMGTTQIDRALCNFGVVTNPGMAQRSGDVTADDDAMYLELVFQMADCPVADKDAILTISIGVKVVDYIAILNYPVMVSRDGTEAPVYNITASANSTGDVMFFDFDFRLDNTSRAEVYNASLVLIPPAYVECNTLESSSGTNMVPVVNTTSDSTMIIAVGDIYFTDRVRLLCRCNARTSYKVPSGINGHYSIATYQLFGDVIQRDGSVLPSHTVWSDMDFVNFTATTTSDLGVLCTSSSLKMGDSNVIFDCQISVSTPSITAAVNGRKGGSGWTPYVRSGDLRQHRYFQVYFPNKMLVDRVEVTQSGTAKVTEIKLAYGNDGQSLLDGDTIPLTGTVSETVQVPNPRDSHVLRVYVTNNDDNEQEVKLTFDFFGCKTSTGGPSGSTAVCAAAAKAVPAPITNPLFFYRSFLVTQTGCVFVCDGVVKDGERVQRCFMSTDGNTWQPLDLRVAAMVGHEPDTNRVFALADDGVTFMSSTDKGRTWASTHVDVFNYAKTQTSYVAAMDVPWIDSSQLTKGTPLTAYKIGAWGANYNYMKKNEGSWIDKLRWNCCT